MKKTRPDDEKAKDAKPAESKDRPSERPERKSSRGEVLQWRPRPRAFVPESDADFFEFRYPAPGPDCPASRILGAERRRPGGGRAHIRPRRDLR